MARNENVNVLYQAKKLYRLFILYQKSHVNGLMQRNKPPRVPNTLGKPLPKVLNDYRFDKVAKSKLKNFGKFK